MNLEFDTLINKKKQQVISTWHNNGDVIPLTIYDNIFLERPTISHDISSWIRKIGKKVDQNKLDEMFYNAYYSFYNEYFELEFDKNELLFTPNVDEILQMTINELSNKDDYIVLCSPINNRFAELINKNDRIAIEIPLFNRKGKYQVNYEYLEMAFANKNTKLFVLCNPGFPTGKLFVAEELDKIGQIAKKHGVIVFSYESHGLITRPGLRYVPFVKANDFNKDISITCISPSKAFNLRGVHSSAVIIYDKLIRNKIIGAMGLDFVKKDSVALIASISALTRGKKYLFQLNSYLFRNKDYIYNYIRKHIPMLSVVKSDATYSAWIDARNLTNNSDKLVEYLFKAEKTLVQSGTLFGNSGEGYIRLNAATRTGNIQLALDRIKEGVKHFYEFEHNNTNNRRR